MEGWVILVLIAVAISAVLIIYDKRKFFAEKFKKILKKSPAPAKENVEKTKAEKPKAEKTKEGKSKKKEEPVQEKKEPVDYDKMVVEDNVSLGKEPETSKNEAVQTFGNIFAEQPKKKDAKPDDDIDIDKLFEELRQSDAENSRRYQMDKYSQGNPVSDMSISDMDDLIENFSFDDLSQDSKNSLMNNGLNASKLSGKELGDLIRSLPPEVKAIIISDVLRPKF